MLESDDRQLPEEILKEDESGRVRTSPERREQLLDEYERSGLSGARFAKLHAINYQTFMNWRKKRRERRLASQESSTLHSFAGDLGLREVVVGGCVGEAQGLRIEIGREVRLCITHPEQVGLAAKLIHHLQGAASC